MTGPGDVADGVANSSCEPAVQPHAWPEGVVNVTDCPPTVTLCTERRFMPVIVIESPPLCFPEEGEMLLMEGGAVAPEADADVDCPYWSVA